MGCWEEMSYNKYNQSGWSMEPDWYENIELSAWEIKKLAIENAFEVKKIKDKNLLAQDIKPFVNNCCVTRQQETV